MSFGATVPAPFTSILESFLRAVWSDDTEADWAEVASVDPTLRAQGDHPTLRSIRRMSLA